MAHGPLRRTPGSAAPGHATAHRITLPDTASPRRLGTDRIDLYQIRTRTSRRPGRDPAGHGALPAQGKIRCTATCDFCGADTARAQETTHNATTSDAPASSARTAS